MELWQLIGIFIFFVTAGFVIGGCTKKPKPDPDPQPNPEPDKPKWEDYYPKGYSKPIDFHNKWIKRNFDSSRWSDYENKIIDFMLDEDRQGKFDELTLAKLLTHKENNKWFFTWTSDLETFGKEDYWSPPDEYVIDKHGLGDCDDFAGFHCDFLDRKSKYWLVWWIEIYWQQRSNGVWKGLGHAITIFKETQESPWRCFSNQQYLGMSYGYADIADVVSKFCPKDDNHKLIKVVARHPMDGYMLWQTTTGHGNENMQLTVKQLKRRIMTRRRTRNG